MSETTSRQVAKLKQSAHNESIKQWERTNEYPKRVINFGWLEPNKIWRLTIHQIFHGMLICEAVLENHNCDKLLDMAFEASESYNCPIQIVVNNIDGRYYK